MAARHETAYEKRTYAVVERQIYGTIQVDTMSLGCVSLQPNPQLRGAATVGWIVLLLLTTSTLDVHLHIPATAFHNRFPSRFLPPVFC